MSDAPTPEPLDSARAARLIAFARTCAAPLDPAEYGVDPLEYL
ncbi:MAG: hypothetical protein ABGY72_16155 [bacterium]